MTPKIIDSLISEIEVANELLGEINAFESTLFKDAIHLASRTSITHKIDSWTYRVINLFETNDMKIDGLRVKNVVKSATALSSPFSLVEEGKTVNRISEIIFKTAEKLETRQDKKTFEYITIDDIDHLALIVKDVDSSDLRGKYDASNFLEDDVEDALIEALGESINYKESDSGAETRDLFTDRLFIKGRRYPAAIMLKGRAVSGELMISNCGKNGDQLLKLAKNSAASVFIVQHVNKIGTDVREALRDHLAVHSSFDKIKICFIDGLDSARILKGLKKDLKALAEKKSNSGRKPKA